MSISLKKYTTNYASDLASVVDELEAKPHQRVANAIVEALLHEQGGKVIGLIGDWGPGKSTIVEILRKELENSNFKVFIFDAWQHKGDPLRRAFIGRACHVP